MTEPTEKPDLSMTREEKIGARPWSPSSWLWLSCASFWRSSNERLDRDRAPGAAGPGPGDVREAADDMGDEPGVTGERTRALMPYLEKKAKEASECYKRLVKMGEKSHPAWFARKQAEELVTRDILDPTT